MIGTVVFDPLVPVPMVIAGVIAVAAGLGVALWRRLPGAGLRALAGTLIVLALSGPTLQREEREALSDIALIAIDASASQTLSDRRDQSIAAANALEAQLLARGGTTVERIEIGDAEGDGRTQIMTALRDALAEIPRARVSGVFIISDGHVHDMDLAPEFSAPLHLLQSGRGTDWDRRLIISDAPAFAILGEPITLSLIIEDTGNVPDGNGFAPLEISVDGEAPQKFQVPIGKKIELPVTLPHGGRNVIQFVVPKAAGELTSRNNSALVQINGVRDRLRVLLVSGEPHAGGRTWRNLLKSDSAVDLVHFTILRPPEKQDGVPVSELSLIAFPTRELFLEKIDDFDLIIFDRYKRRGILPAAYLDNVASYVQGGGAVLVAAGPDFASADSIYRSPLARIMPATPTARVIEQGYVPKISDLGKRHPVTTGLTGSDSWGRWMRQIDVTLNSGNVLMTGVNDRPLLILDRVDQGRVALLASDHAWLWSRGYDGGGPQLELLRRLAHWMMGEPDLEEEALTAEVRGKTIEISRRTLQDSAGPITVISPSGNATELQLTEIAPGHFKTQYTGGDLGLYRLKDETAETVIGLGPAAPKEFENTIATGEILSKAILPTRGGIQRIEDGIPSLRTVSQGRPAAGRGWLGITPRGAFETTNVQQTSLLPAWLVLLLSTALILAAWLREGRR